MTIRPVASATARIPAGRRPSPIGVISTIVAIPLACPSRASSIERSVSLNARPGMAGESRNRWSCASTIPRDPTGRGPETLTTWASGTLVLLR